MLIVERSTAGWLANWFYKVPQAGMTRELQPSSIDDGDGREIVTFKRNLCVFQWPSFHWKWIRWKCQMNANFPSVDFLRICRTIRTALKFRKRKKNSSLGVYVLHKTWNKAFSRRSLVGTAKKCSKTCHAHAKLLFRSSNLLLFSVLVAVADVVAKDGVQPD